MNNINKISNVVRALGVDSIFEAKSGHPGMVLGAATALTTLYANHLHYDPNDASFMFRDRFVMSAGHGSALLYAVLSLFTNGIGVEDLKQFRKKDSRTSGHPCIHKTPFVDASTGPLGQGIAMAVGMAIAQKKYAEEYDEKDCKLFHNSKVYVLAGDGCFMEGVAMEALDIAANLNLNNLIILFDDNNITIDGQAEMVRNIKPAQVYIPKGFYCINVNDGNDVDEINNAIELCKNSSKPSIISIKTKIGYASKFEDKPAAHAAVFDAAEISNIKANLRVEDKMFFVDDETKKLCEKIKKQKTAQIEKTKKILKEYESKYNVLYNELINVIKNPKVIKVDETLGGAIDKPMASRASGGLALNNIASQLGTALIGGNADVAASTQQVIKSSGYIKAGNYNAQNIAFGIRENAMGSICNGLALFGGLKVFCSTFFCFVDYMMPALQMAALQKLPVVFIYTTDSIGAGEDGATHQAVAQLAWLRAIPNFLTFRPSDSKEAVLCYEIAFNQTKTPSAILLTRQSLPVLNLAVRQNVARGAYIAYKPKDKVKGIFIATGSEVSLAIEAAKKLENFAVVNMVCAEIFDKLSKKDQDKILDPKITNRVTVEAAQELSLAKYRGLDGKAIAVNEFGFSASGPVLFEAFGFTVDNLIKVAKQ